MSFFTILSVASSIGQAFASYQQAAAMKAYYDAQADLSRLQYAQKKVEAKEQGVKVLKATNKALGAAVAQAAAGGILSTEGSALMQQQVSLRGGAEDFNLTQFNVDMLQNMSAIEYANLTQAGKTTMQSGIMSALTGFGTNISSAYQGGLFSGLNRKTTPTSFGSYTAQDLDNMDRGY